LDCYAENGGCTIFGCAKAPAEEARVEITLPDLSAVGMASSHAAPVTGSLQPAQLAVSVAPPPRIGPGQTTGGAAVQVYVPLEYEAPRKSRVTFVLLGIFFGCFGVHNFYAGRIRQGVFQLCVTFFSCFYLALISWVWAMVEVCMVGSDDEGVAFK
jgi:TM2 domain-containing membrane protein YozV